MYRHLKKIYRKVHRKTLYKEISKIPVLRKVGKRSKFVTTKTEWRNYLEENKIQISDFSDVEFESEPMRSGRRPLILADRKLFSDFVFKLYNENSELPRDELITFVYFLIKEKAKNEINSSVTMPEVAYKFHNWFLKEYINPQKIRFSSKEAGRKILLGVCREGYIKDITYKSILRAMRMDVKCYFSGGINELRKILNLPPLYKHKTRFKTKKEGREAIKNFIINNPEKRTRREIERALCISLYTYFDSLLDAFEYAGVEYTGRKILPSAKEKLVAKIVETIKKNPKITRAKLQKLCHTDLKSVFDDVTKPWKLVDVEVPWRMLSREERIRRIKKFIEENPGISKRKLQSTLHISLKHYPEIRKILDKFKNNL